MASTKNQTDYRKGVFTDCKTKTHRFARVCLRVCVCTRAGRTLTAVSLCRDEETAMPLFSPSFFSCTMLTPLDTATGMASRRKAGKEKVFHMDLSETEFNAKCRHKTEKDLVQLE